MKNKLTMEKFNKILIIMRKESNKYFGTPRLSINYEAANSFQIYWLAILSFVNFGDYWTSDCQTNLSDYLFKKKYQITKNTFYKILDILNERDINE